MIIRFIMWRHRYFLGHTQTHRRVSPYWGDVGARGDLWSCSCGTDWAR